MPVHDVHILQETYFHADEYNHKTTHHSLGMLGTCRYRYPHCRDNLNWEENADDEFL